MSDSPFNPATDIPRQSGRVFFITGGTTGLGASSILTLASHSPSRIFFSGRNKTKATELIAQVAQSCPGVELTFIECDQSNLSSVQKAAQEFKSQCNRLDVLMCNAGVMALPSSLSADGYEIQFATNHIGHALLIKLLLPTLKATASNVPDSDVRIINLSSIAYTTAPTTGIEFSKLKTSNANFSPFYKPNKWLCYGQSKLANLLYARQLALHHPCITSVAVHPGFIRTSIHSTENVIDRQIINHVADKWLSNEEGAWNQVWAATTAKENLENGAYYEPVARKVVPSTGPGRDDGLAEKLWEWTERELVEWVG